MSLAALVVLFALVIPKVSGATYRQVAHQLHRLSIAEIALLTVVWLIGLVAYAGVLTASLPGLRRTQGFTLNTASSAVSNVVPFGGAVGVGATYGMCRSWGFGVPKTTLAILVSGIWNIFLKLGLPIIALVLLVAEGRATGGLVGAAIFGLAVLVVAVLALTLVLRSDRLAISSVAGCSGWCRSGCGWLAARITPASATPCSTSATAAAPSSPGAGPA